MTAPRDTPPEPDPRHWIARRWFTASGALVAELRPDVEPLAIFERLARRRHCLFLDSAARDAAPRAETAEAATTPRLGRFSFVAADPIHSLEVVAAGDGRDATRVNEAFSILRSLLGELA